MRYAAPLMRRPFGIALVCLACLGPALLAEESPRKLPEEQASLLRDAQKFEQGRNWREACARYDELRAFDRSNPQWREAYFRCLRHFRQARRHEDIILRLSVEKLSSSEALNLFDQVLDLVSTKYVEKERLELSGLVHEAVREVKQALDNPTFRRACMPRARDRDRDIFASRLDHWLQRKIQSRSDAREVIRDLTVGAMPLALKPGVLALELACGLCNSLDEYSFYLAPGRYSHVEAALKGKFVGIGVELTVNGDHIEVARVYRKGPAAEAGLARGDRIVRIDRKWIDPLAPEAAAELLMGKAGSEVELEVIPAAQTVARSIKVERQAVLANSVDFKVLGGDDNYLGYIRIHSFQDTTAREVKDALEQLRAFPLRGIILDLRGNLGGAFQASLEVSELFLGDGHVLVHTYSPLHELNRTFKSRSLSPNLLPLVVLIDGETASAAEVVAGAFKDHQRATLIGQTSYGKGSIQRVYPLERLPGGLRLTVAKFASPLRQSYTDRGVTPDVLVDLNADPLKQAEQVLLPMMMTPKPMLNMTSPDRGADPES